MSSSLNSFRWFVAVHISTNVLARTHTCSRVRKRNETNNKLSKKPIIRTQSEQIPHTSLEQQKMEHCWLTVSNIMLELNKLLNNSALHSSYCDSNTNIMCWGIMFAFFSCLFTCFWYRAKATFLLHWIKEFNDNIWKKRRIYLNCRVVKFPCTYAKAPYHCMVVISAPCHHLGQKNYMKYQFRSISPTY